MATNNNLTAEVLSQILARVPVKSLLRFRSISKSWCSVIDDSYFALTHLKLYHNGRHCDNTQLVSFHIERYPSYRRFEGCMVSLRSSDKLSEIDQIVKPSRKSAYIVAGSCLGLLLILYYYPRRELRLWNPCLRNKSIVLPPCPLRTSNNLHVVYALGFSPLANSFKVIAFQIDRSKYYERNLEPIPIAVLTIGDDNKIWRTTHFSGSHPDSPRMPCRRTWEYKRFTFFQGALHCITSSYDTHLLSFDLDREEFSWARLPDARRRIDLEGKIRILFRLGESLALMTVSNVERCIWAMKKDDCGAMSWVLRFSCASTIQECRSFSEHWFINPKIFQLDNDNDGTSFIFGNSSYNIATSEITELVKTCDNDTFTLDTYLETLMLHKGVQGYTLTPFP